MSWGVGSSRSRTALAPQALESGLYHRACKILKCLSRWPNIRVQDPPTTEATMTAGLHPVMAMLAQRLPLTLLLDLRRPEGPDSEVLFLIEQPHGRAARDRKPEPEPQDAPAC